LALSPLFADSALQFYDTSGAYPTAKFGWEGDPNNGIFFIETPQQSKNLTLKNGTLHIQGPIQSTKSITADEFVGKGNKLTHVKASNSDSLGGKPASHYSNAANLTGNLPGSAFSAYTDLIAEGRLAVVNERTDGDEGTTIPLPPNWEFQHTHVITAAINPLITHRGGTDTDYWYYVLGGTEGIVGTNLSVLKTGTYILLNHPVSSSTNVEFSWTNRPYTAILLNTKP